MYRSYRRIKDDEGERKFEYQPGDRMTVKTSDDINVQFKLRLLADLLKCPLCFGFFRDATTIKECLHTFCKICVFEYLHKGGVTCPKCSEPIPSNFSDGISFDRSIQNIVDKLLPEFMENERKEKDNLYNFCGIKDLCPLANTVSQNREAVKIIESWDATQGFFQSVAIGAFSLDILDAFIELLPIDSSIKRLKRPYIRICSKMTILYVVHYLSRKLDIEDPSSIEIYLSGMIVPHSHTLEFICRSRKINNSECIVLRYTVDSYLTMICDTLENSPRNS